jgi:hypothetical protein
MDLRSRHDGCSCGLADYSPMRKVHREDRTGVHATDGFFWRWEERLGIAIAAGYRTPVRCGGPMRCPAGNSRNKRLPLPAQADDFAEITDHVEPASHPVGIV